MRAGGSSCAAGMRRETVSSSFGAELPACVVAMEACCGAHHLGRAAREQGHQVRLMSPEYVRPYVKAQKNDDRDAEAIAEAATRPTMRFVELKSEAQLDMQSLHRARDRLVGERTALINQLRAVLLERGIVVAARDGASWSCISTALTGRRRSCRSARATLRAGRGHARASGASSTGASRRFDAEFAAQARTDEAARRLTTIPGIGALNATALVAAIGDGRTFARGRDLAAWLGLVPRQVTTGGKPRLLGITKRGNVYLRKMLIHGARAALPTLSSGETPLGRVAARPAGAGAREHVVVALAAKLARIVWAVLRTGGSFEATAAAA